MIIDTNQSLEQSEQDNIDEILESPKLILDENILEQESKIDKPVSEELKRYWSDKEEEAIKKYLTTESLKEKNFLFKKILDIPIKKLVDGVTIYVQKKYGKIESTDVKELKQEAYLDLLSKLNSYTDFSKKSFSFYQTIVKNYVLGKKIHYDNIKRKKVEYTDIEKYAGDFVFINEVVNQKDFKDLREKIIKQIEKEITGTKKYADNEKQVANILIYMIDNWDKMNFDSKNQFVRQLKNYGVEKESVVDKTLKKLKSAYLKVKNGEDE